jgi:hypothetical protein
MSLAIYVQLHIPSHIPRLMRQLTPTVQSIQSYMKWLNAYTWCRALHNDNSDNNAWPCGTAGVPGSSVQDTVCLEQQCSGFVEGCSGGLRPAAMVKRVIQKRRGS